MSSGDRICAAPDKDYLVCWRKGRGRCYSTMLRHRPAGSDGLTRRISARCKLGLFELFAHFSTRITKLINQVGRRVYYGIAGVRPIPVDDEKIAVINQTLFQFIAMHISSWPNVAKYVRRISALIATGKNKHRRRWQELQTRLKRQS